MEIKERLLFLVLSYYLFFGARRTTVGGFQLVNGTPVHRTEMGKDPAAPVATSQLERLFDGEVGVNCVSVPLGIVEVGQEAIIAAMRAATTAAAAATVTVPLRALAAGLPPVAVVHGTAPRRALNAMGCRCGVHMRRIHPWRTRR